MATQAPTLSKQQSRLLSQVLLDIRKTRSLIEVARTPLSAFLPFAVDALKDLFYLLNLEDPMSRLPVRRHMLQNDRASNLLLPMLHGLYADSSKETSPKRWSIPVYQLLRIFSVLTRPIEENNSLLHKGCAIEQFSLTFRMQLAYSKSSLPAFVELLIYYLKRKEAKEEALVPAEDLKLEDARIRNILNFVRNILRSSRRGVSRSIVQLDRGIHLAIVANLVSSNFYSTLDIIFSTEDYAGSQYTDVVFLVAEIYALTLRHSLPRDMYVLEKELKHSTSDERVLPAGKSTAKKATARNLRAAILRDRTARYGKQGPVTSSARWTSRHSGIVAVKRTNPDDEDTEVSGLLAKASIEKFVTFKEAADSISSTNSRRPLQELLEVNAEFLSLSTAKRSTKGGVEQTTSIREVPRDIQQKGLKGILALTHEMIESSFPFLIRELKKRIEETKQRSCTEEKASIDRAERALLVIVGVVVGFHCEKHGKILPQLRANQRQLKGPFYNNCMNSVLSSDLKDVEEEWKAVEAGIRRDTLETVFQILIKECKDLREHGKGDNRAGKIEAATFAALQIMKMLQRVAVYLPRAKQCRWDEIPCRMKAMVILKRLFENRAFRSVPSALAKKFTTKFFSFRHLANVVDMAYTFVTLFRNEGELRLMEVDVMKRRKKRKKVVECTAEARSPEAESLTNSSEELDASIPDSEIEDSSSDEEDEPPWETKEIVGDDIVRSLAHFRTLHNLVLPIRVALSQMPDVSGRSYTIPEGSRVLLSRAILAKSAYVYSTLWKVAQEGEKGALCGHFFTFENMHLMNIIMKAAVESNVTEDSVVGQLDLCAKEVTRVFFSWLHACPVLALDMFFPLDKKGRKMYVTCLKEQEERRARAESEEEEENWYREFEAMGTGGDEDVPSSPPRESKRRKLNPPNCEAVVEAPESDRSSIEEDEDVDEEGTLQIDLQ